MKTKEGINILRVEGKENNDDAEMLEVMNNCFQTVFTRERVTLEDRNGWKNK